MNENQEKGKPARLRRQKDLPPRKVAAVKGGAMEAAGSAVKVLSDVGAGVRNKTA